jgi:uncharacterized protein with ParB-like and HNH nuclease domain
MDYKTTINNLFSPRKVQFEVPTYQRAYSWYADNDKPNEKQISQFISDLKEQPEKVPYFFGHFLFEKDLTNENKYYTIDGQQRLTTLVIFFSCLMIVLKEKEAEINLSEIQEDYLQKSKEHIKFKTVEYDDNFFQNVIINNKTDVANTKSRKRIKEAKDYFLKVMRKTDLNELIRWKEVIENASITTDEVRNKIEATQRFTFQNDRGKDLTELEKLKAFLMFNIYLATKGTEKNADDLIKFIQKEFQTIYLKLEEINSVNEDQILNYHCIAFISISGNAFENVKNTINKEQDKISWITDFSTSLKMTFENIKKIEDRTKTNSCIGDVLLLDSYNSYPLLIKLFHFHSETLDEIEHLFRLMEITLFRMEYSIGNFRTNRFHSFAQQYNGDLTSIESKLLESAENGFQWWWNFKSDFQSFLKGSSHYRHSTKYLLWKYENNLRFQKKEPPMLLNEYTNLYQAHNLENTIDHWTPQNPDENFHSQEFKDKYLHNIGNLVLATRGRNSQDNNNIPEERDRTSILLSRQELEARGNKWEPTDILERQKRIVEFALEYWAPKLK